MEGYHFELRGAASRYFDTNDELVDDGMEVVDYRQRENVKSRRCENVEY